jgi:hypothetical protein
MTTRNVNLLWKNFRGIRKLNSINSDVEFGADIAHGVRLSKEKSGQYRSIRSSGWFSQYTVMGEDVIRLYSANMSGYTYPDQLIAFTKTSGAINAWIVTDNTEVINPVQIATFPLATDVTDVCMTQWGDRLVMVVAFGTSNLGFVYYSADATIGGTQMGTSNFYYRLVPIVETTTNKPVEEITSVCPYRSRLAINGVTTYKANDAETIYGVWFSEAGNAINFAMTPITSASETTPFFVEVGDKINHLEEYHGLTAFGNNRSYNITGTSQNDYKVLDLTAKGVKNNAVFTLNGQCAYVDSWAKNIFTLRDNIDGTIGFDNAIGDDIQDYLQDVGDVTINVIGRRIRMLKSSGQSLVYDVDIGEWVEESFTANSRAVTFLNKEYFCDGTATLYQITDDWGVGSQQTPNEDGYYSHYRTNLMWLDSQSSVKSHLYPFAVILEPRTSNDFYIKFTTDRGEAFNARVTKAGFSNVATYSNDDTVPENGSQFVADDEDLSGRVFFAMSQTELLVTVDRPPYWRYLQIDIYTTSPAQQFNISGIEAKNTEINTEMLDY